MSNNDRKKDKYKLYTEKIEPAIVKKKSKKLIISLVLLGAGIAALFIIPPIVNKVNHIVEVNNSEFTLDSDDVQEISLVENSDVSTTDNREAFNNMPSTINNINNSLVSISSDNTSVLNYIIGDNETESEDEYTYTGLIIGETKTRYVIMTNNIGIDKGERVKVSIGDSIVSGMFLAKSPNINVALVSVKKNVIPDSVRNSINVIKLGNSNNAALGSFVISYGISGDTSNTYDYGIISKKDVLSIVDANVGIINTNILSTINRGGFLFDSSGNLLGIGTDRGTSSGTFKAIGISDIRTIIEQLSADRDIVLFGIYGEDVTDSIASNYNVPRGVYITDVEFDSPAYKAGLQSGDIVSRIDGNDVSDMNSIENILSSYKPGKTLVIDIYRKNKDGYSGMTFKVSVVRYKSE